MNYDKYDKYVDKNGQFRSLKINDYIPSSIGGAATGAALGAGVYVGLSDEVDPDLIATSGVVGGMIGTGTGINSVKTEYELEKNLYLNKLAQAKMNALEKAEIEQQLFYQPNEYDLNYYIPQTPEEKEALLNQINQLKIKAQTTGTEIIQKIKKDGK